MPNEKEKGLVQVMSKKREAVNYLRNAIRNIVTEFDMVKND